MTDQLDLDGLEGDIATVHDMLVTYATNDQWHAWHRLMARLRASEAATAAAVERAERAVELLADVHGHAGNMVGAFLDGDRREQLICADAVNKGHSERFRFLLALPTPSSGGE